jgi:formylglycine-generating enzyme required for sulfatase activity/predicted MPP superfamily phosphohydrolase
MDAFTQSRLRLMRVGLKGSGVTVTVRILHLSDIHFSERQAWDQDPVIKALAGSVKTLADDGLKPDIALITGDVANAGRADEYARAEDWLHQRLLPAAGLGKNQLLLVPGNHDVDRSLVKVNARALQNALLANVSQDQVAEVLSDPNEREPLLRRHSAWLKFASRFSVADGIVPWWGEHREIAGVRIHFAGLCTSWMSWQNDEQGKLLVGRWQANAVLADCGNAAISIALMHHPWNWLVESDMLEVRDVVYAKCSMVLSGHRHIQRGAKLDWPSGTVLELPAGSCYGGSNWPNGYQLLELEFADGKLQRVKAHLRAWVENEWIRDRNAYQGKATNGTAIFETAASQGQQQKPTHGRSIGQRQRRLGTISEDEALAAYCEQVAKRHGELVLGGLDLISSDPATQQQPLSLAGIYVGLDTTRIMPVNDIELFMGASPPRTRKYRRRALKRKVAESHTPEVITPTRARAGSRAITVLESVIATRSVVLLGNPGSGKTTFLNHLASSIAARNWDALPGWPPKLRKVIPVVVLIRDFAAWASRDAHTNLEDAGAGLMWAFIAHELGIHNLSSAVPGIERALENGNTLILFDGLDEVSATVANELVRPSVEDFLRRYGKNRTVVTCRVLSYQQPAWRLPAGPIRDYEIAALDAGKIDRFIVAWYAEVGSKWHIPADRAIALTQSLARAVRRADLWRLVANPLLLTVAALVHTREEGTLPEARAALYEKAVDTLLWNWEKQKYRGVSREPPLPDLLLNAKRNQSDLRTVLEHLAYEAHGEINEAHDRDAVTGIGEHRLRSALSDLHPQKSYDWAQSVINAMRSRAGLLIDRAPGVFGFPHRTFQEYLAAVHLARRGNFAKEALSRAAEGAFWREVVLLAAGYHVHVNRDYERPAMLVEALLPKTETLSDLSWRFVWLAGELCCDIGAHRLREVGREELFDRTREYVTALVERGALSPHERADAADVLSQLEDPRFDPNMFYLARSYRGAREAMHGFVTIPAGPFTMGSRRSDPDSAFDEYGNRSPLDLPYSYSINRYPVTVAQFRVFIEEKGYDCDHWWTPEGVHWKAEKGLREPVAWVNQRQFDNKPVVNVTWFEAMAYAAWLAAQLRRVRPDAITNGQTVRLPTEAEWEKAAQSHHTGQSAWAQMYSNEFCSNAATTSGRRPVRDIIQPGISTGLRSATSSGVTPVGIYPTRATSTGLHEMTRNVWQWTLSTYRGYPYQPSDGRNAIRLVAARVLRGGSYCSDARYERSAARNALSPSVSRQDIGFRLVISPVDSMF